MATKEKGSAPEGARKALADPEILARVQGYARQYGGARSSDEAAEISQEALARLLESDSAPPDKLDAYLKGIVRNIGRERSRDAARAVGRPLGNRWDSYQNWRGETESGSLGALAARLVDYVGQLGGYAYPEVVAQELTRLVCDELPMLVAETYGRGPNATAPLQETIAASLRRLDVPESALEAATRWPLEAVRLAFRRAGMKPADVDVALSTMRQRRSRADREVSERIAALVDEWARPGGLAPLLGEEEAKRARARARAKALRDRRRRNGDQA